MQSTLERPSSSCVEPPPSTGCRTIAATGHPPPAAELRSEERRSSAAAASTTKEPSSAIGQSRPSLSSDGGGHAFCRGVRPSWLNVRPIIHITTPSPIGSSSQDSGSVSRYAALEVLSNMQHTLYCNL